MQWLKDITRKYTVLSRQKRQAWKTATDAPNKNPQPRTKYPCKGARVCLGRQSCISETRCLLAPRVSSIGNVLPQGRKQK
eukprot:scaffold14571_cov21-Prasinocladus_malaysianus.AAC.1